MSANQRKAVYLALTCLNAVLVVLQSQGAIPAGLAHYAALVSFALAMGMKEFAASDSEASK